MYLRLVAATAAALVALALPAAAQDPQALSGRYTALRAQLADNPFGRPLHVESSDNPSEQRGAIYAVIEQPFKRVLTGLRHATQWCEVLILQANVKNCQASDRSTAALAIFVARKPTDSPGQAYRVDFGFEARAPEANYLHVALDAPEGPLGSSDYRIRLEATPIEGNRTFLHLGYSYTLRAGARIGMNLYLGTTGRDKVGFSIVDRTRDGKPVYVGGVRGIVERNTMRYYLALEAYLGTLDAAVPERVEKRLRAFHAGLERYPRQLHELELAEYLDIKRGDVARLAQVRR